MKYLNLPMLYSVVIGVGLTATIGICLVHGNSSRELAAHRLEGFWLLFYPILAMVILVELSSLDHWWHRFPQQIFIGIAAGVIAGSITVLLLQSDERSWSQISELGIGNYLIPLLIAQLYPLSSWAFGVLGLAGSLIVFRTGTGFFRRSVKKSVR